MCNLYSITTNQAAIIALFRVINRYVGNLPPMPGVFPDYPAPVIRDTGAGREMVTMRWGMPPPPRTPGPPRFPRELDHRDLVVQGGNQASCCWFVTKRPTFMKNLSQLHQANKIDLVAPLKLAPLTTVTKRSGKSMSSV